MTANLPETLSAYTSQHGANLLDLSKEKPVLLTFLRHAGCSFCREALSDIKGLVAEIESAGTEVAFVHLEDEQTGQSFLQKYGLPEKHLFSDPEKKLYKAFGLRKMSPLEFAKVDFLKRGFAAMGNHGVGMPKSDPWQMPGVFLIKDGEVLKSFRHQSAADRPDYLELAQTAPV